MSMRIVDKTQSRVVLYSGTTETMVIKRYKRGKSLFSIGSRKLLPITENGNGDIFFADYYGKAVVDVNQAGEFRFKYKGNISRNSIYKSFQPGGIVTNVNEEILIIDDVMNSVHVIDSDGNFLRSKNIRVWEDWILTQTTTL